MRAVLCRLPENGQTEDEVNNNDSTLIRPWLSSFGISDDKLVKTERHGQKGYTRIVKCYFSDQESRDDFLAGFGRRRPPELELDSDTFPRRVYARRDLAPFELQYDYKLRQWCREVNSTIHDKNEWFSVRDLDIKHIIRRRQENY